MTSLRISHVTNLSKGSIILNTFIATVSLKCSRPLNIIIAIGKALNLSPPFPLLHTVRAGFLAHGVPSIFISFTYFSVSNLDTEFI